MEQRMTIDQMDFATYCVGLVSCKLGISQPEVFDKLTTSGIMREYIVGAYDVLHCLSSDYIADELISCMKEKGVIE